MKDVRVLIHAAGRGDRWDGDYPKQLSVVAGETILGRIIRQCRQFGHKPLLVTRDPRLAELSKRTLYPEQCRWHLETLLSSRRYWKKRTVILLSDVLYTPGFLQTVFDEKGPHTFFGCPSQLFAVSFGDRRKVAAAARRLLFGIKLDGHEGLISVEQHGHHRLIDLCRYIDGIDIGRDIYGPSYVLVKDPWVCDVDSLAEYHELLVKTKGKDMWC